MIPAWEARVWKSLPLFLLSWLISLILDRLTGELLAFGLWFLIITLAWHLHHRLQSFPDKENLSQALYILAIGISIALLVSTSNLKDSLPILYATLNVFFFLNYRAARASGVSLISASSAAFASIASCLLCIVCLTSIAFP
jgi:hypothetical protein